ncbi:SusC/RagA family TonB-linked outer membrane protein [uncultured Polaribacter sp.]|uniref:SusC/RagA family TonB-linked outer membrane protein n=1 Tax=uncultured Polaribacter sp. TaxID=174711 RepID=UPI002629EB1A|nr:SusC/RagA family TonB-linked outer membrane protein [uncultured Polaribacter sp.]
MKTKFKGILTLLLAFVVQITFAQEKTVSGTVSDSSGALPGVSVAVKGGANGTETDFDGKYSVKVKAGDVLIFRYLGFKVIEKSIGTSNTINVLMVEDNNVLDEIVVTALGIKREGKSLGYSVTKIKGAELEQKSEADLARVLRGKAAGVQVTSSNGISGSATNVIIRGYSSITGSNQPLYIVDGVPFNTNTNAQTSYFDNSTESSRMLDLDPNNIATLNVLKGLSATTLYGERGRNGVVVITTKNGDTRSIDKTSVSVSSSVFFSDPHLPDYQNEFGGGFNQEFGWYFSNWGPAFSDTNPNVYGSYFNSVEDGQVYVNHPFATNSQSDFIAGYEDLAASPYAYKAYDNVAAFFRTGIVKTNSIQVSGGNGTSRYSVNYSKHDEDGFTPGNSLSRDNIGVGGSTKKGKFKFGGTLNFAKTDYISPPVAASNGSGVFGGGASVFGDLMYTPRNVDLMNIPYQRADGGSLYYRESNSIQNPRWTVENSKTGQLINRVYGSFNVSYDLSESMKLAYKYGIDTYTESSFYGQNAGGIDGNALGVYRTTYITNTLKDHTLSLTYNKDFSEDLNFNAIVGANSTRAEFDRDGLESTDQIAFGTLRHYNFVNTSSVNSFSGANMQFSSEENTLGTYIDATLGYKGYLFLNAAARMDWTSTLEAENNSILYPSASLSFVPTEAIEGLKGDVLNYLKARIGFGTSAGFPNPYNTRNTLSLSARSYVDNDGNVVSTNTTSNFLGNANLKPELVSEIEFGLDTRLFNRVGLNVSVFKRTTEDLITNKDLDPSTGYTSTVINGGTIEATGIEVDLNADVIKTKDFNWNTSLTFYKDKTTVVELPEDVDIIFLNSGLNAAIEGEAYGVLVGTQIQRDDSGNYIVGDDGNYLETVENDLVIGNPNPDFTSTINNTISYKNFKFSFSFNYRHGGDIYSLTAATLLNRGLVEFPLDRYGTYVLPGVTTTGAVNTTQINATNVAFDNWLYGPNEFRVYDGTTLRLSDVSLSYSLPKENLENTPFSGISFTASGSNLWYKAFNFPDAINFDTNSLSSGVGNSVGVDWLTGPSAKRYGLSLKLSF